jgi:hypothetical protein
VKQVTKASFDVVEMLGGNNAEAAHTTPEQPLEQ